VPFDGSVLLALFWLTAAVLAVTYLLLFLGAGRPVALRPGRLALLVGSVVVARLVLLVLGMVLVDGFDIVLLVATGGLALLLWGGRRFWLCRIERDVLREQIETACRGLFLPCTESAPGCFLLTAKTGSYRLWVKKCCRCVQLLVQPPRVGPGKPALLLAWLSKQYPGPVPRLRIVFNKE
jgi:hypothetical protein